jgi:hypothetical protein
VEGGTLAEYAARQPLSVADAEKLAEMKSETA